MPRLVSVLTYPRPQTSNFILRFERGLPEPLEPLSFKAALGDLEIGSFHQPRCLLNTWVSFEDSMKTIQDTATHFSLRETSVNITNENGMLFISGTISLDSKRFAKLECTYDTSEDFQMLVRRDILPTLAVFENGSTKFSESEMECGGFYQKELEMEGISFSNVNSGPLLFKLKNVKKGTALQLLRYPELVTLTQANDRSEYESSNFQCTVRTPNSETPDVLAEIVMFATFSLDIKFRNFPILEESSDVQVSCPDVNIVSYYPTNPIIHLTVKNQCEKYYSYYISKTSDDVEIDATSNAHHSISISIQSIFITTLFVSAAVAWMW